MHGNVQSSGLSRARRLIEQCSWQLGKIISEVAFLFSYTVFPNIVAAATILFWIHPVRKLFKFSFPLCNENLNSFLTRWGNYSRRGNYSREETIWGNTVSSNAWNSTTHIAIIDIPRSWSRNLLEANCSTKELLEISTDCGFGFEKA